MVGGVGGDVELDGSGSKICVGTSFSSMMGGSSSYLLYLESLFVLYGC